ncbi:GGDEF domain-containing response regulator [Tundrisphaera lichenicola]|uniref:GGDEF domain-containing response regulator n=1 Tax=Tundrisphaera lichenicola TaxID=2029860 RepID=UPI003EBF6267
MPVVPEPVNEGNRQTMKIVIAEDDDVSRIVLKKTLENLGYNVVALSEGSSTWDYLQKFESPILITDWMMPGLDGLELCQRLRGRGPDAPYTYAILLTARHSREERLQALHAGADDLLAKPLDRAELVARINVARRIVTMEDLLRSRSIELERMKMELESKNRHLAEIATSDGLTGLKNHRFFREAIDRQFAGSYRMSIPFSVLMIDVDEFKPFNDSFGHPAGDQALIEVAEVLRSNVREMDVLARYGGEEFAVLLPGADEEASLLMAERLRLAIQRHPWGLRPLTISLGVTTMERRVIRASDLIEMADRSLYHSKTNGRDRVTHSRDLPNFQFLPKIEALPDQQDVGDVRISSSLA